MGVSGLGGVDAHQGGDLDVGVGEGVGDEVVAVVVLEERGGKRRGGASEG